MGAVAFVPALLCQVATLVTLTKRGPETSSPLPFRKGQEKEGLTNILRV